MAVTNAMDGAICSVAEGGTGLATLTANSVLLGNGTANVQLIAPSTSGNVLTSNGTTWTSAAAAGGSELVLLATATASTSSTLDFTSVITSSYSSYRLVFENLLTSTTATIGVKLSADNGANYTLNFGSLLETLQFGASQSNTLTGINNTNPAVISTSRQATFSGYGSFAVDTNKIVWESLTLENTSGNNQAARTSIFSQNGNATAVNAIRFLPSAGTFTSGKIYLYGVKNT